MDYLMNYDYTLLMKNVLLITARCERGLGVPAF
jgi:hypothetical protein